ncbi:MAG: nitrogenase molybdenum-iron protein alpha chain [Pseudodesulfovibrio sp.]|jgi:nitrogenase molybdenum-iron protein alpha chain|uniref:Nitrogenase protein alpha chain n=1 Tax=Pseudodesulfovibrio indicus TaxID=1716143 RepID=A0A126QMI2_9BACT|nr:nitrogenase molybdenum-iron protein alpha chain [Pseudodesulfovibrio indicus]AMK10976.1 nitrogenase molybdenum-iron protein alpha chain [Pseudodesulfovibrio indicus]TDT91976.1 nitrogenase molybdenum-iron protein alpha chain [Pseudodesulfovibrio indicus]
MAKTKKVVQLMPTDIKEELLKKYPPKVARKRAQQIMINEATESEAPPEILANVRTIPGIITMRGCTYAGCKGVIMGPTRDIVNITHGPIGCGFYSWLTRRNQTDAGTDGENYMPYCFSTDMQDQDIIFGGEKKLAAAIQEAYDLFHPKGICIFATCPVGLIGDDIHAVAKKMKAKFGDCNVFAFSCEGYKGVSQSAGHHIANNQVFSHLVGENETPKEGKYKINLLGEYNIGGDGFEIDRILKKCGITNISTFSGNSTYDQFASAQHADLNTVMCHRSINYVADMLETKYGIPWIKVNFIGAKSTAKSLRKIAEYFADQELIDRVEAVIAEEMPDVDAVAADVRQRTEGKTAMLFVGGSRAHHYQDLFAEMGMKTLSAGYEFAHRDDYEGREVLPNLTVDADSRNIEEIEVEADEKLYSPRKTEAEYKALEEAGFKFKHYEGMNDQMDKGTLVIDDLNQYEADKLVELLKPDIFCAGIKEKFSIQKLGIPMKQLHSYDSGGPYAGFKGAINFYKEIDRLVSSKVWSYMKAPWQESPELTATFVWE